MHLNTILIPRRITVHVHYTVLLRGMYLAFTVYCTQILFSQSIAVLLFYMYI